MIKGNLRSLILFAFCSFVLLSFFPVKGLAAEEYAFERMWPVLEQPWYNIGNYSSIAINDQSDVYVMSFLNDIIQKFSSSGEFITGWAMNGYVGGFFPTPNDIAADGQGNVYVADFVYNRIQKFSSSGAFISKWGSEGSGDGQFDYPNGIGVEGAPKSSIGSTMWNVETRSRRPFWG